MKKGNSRFIIVSSLLLTVALVLTSCTKTTTSTQTTTSSQATTSTQVTTSSQATTSTQITTLTTVTTSPITTSQALVPIYGGTMTMINDIGTNNPGSWDMGLTNNGGVTSVYDNPYLEPYFAGDVDKFGPRGNDQDSFQLPQYIPSQYMTGYIAQSWSFQTSPLSLTITLKPGIMWTGNTNIGMASRELVASDCAFAGTRQLTSPTMGPYFTWLKDCVAVDKYTFRWDFNSYQANWQFFLFYGGGTAFPFSPESATAGGANWKNQVGTGPFMLTDFVDGSSCTFTRNPNYWGMTTINGKQYQEPFIDKLVYLIVPDQSTELAALQTGKIDLYTQVASNQATNLKQRAPDMIQEKWLGDSVYIYKMNRLDTAEPVSNLQVRQALFMATDFQTIANNVFGGGDILGWPVGRGNPSYTPLENQSAQVQALFSFNTAQAKQMLTAAGYPNGFSINITVNASIQQEIDAATIMVADWAQIGVKVNIISLNQVALASEKTANTFTGLLAWPVAVANPLTPMQWYSGTTVGYTYKTGEPLDVEETAALAEMDPLKEQADATQFSKDALVDCGIIPLTNNYLINCYWPWLTNYYGEIDGAYHNQVVMIRELWINQSLKTSLKY